MNAHPWAFHLHFGALVAVGAVGCAYGLSVRSVAAARGRQALPTRRQLWLLAMALLALVIALTWPVADLAAHWSLTALLVQRLLLTLVAAPLLLMATPAAVLAALTRPAKVDAVLETITRPAVAVVGFTVIAVGTLFTPAVAAQASSPVVRGVFDVALVVGGFILWGPVLRNIPGASRPQPVGMAAYMFVQSVVPGFPSVIFIFSRHPLYHAFAGAHHAIGLSAVGDQELAGVVAKVATLPVLWTVAWVALSRAAHADGDGDEAGVLTWADAERHLERVARAEHRHASGKEPRRRSRPSMWRPSATARQGWFPPTVEPPGTVVEPPATGDSTTPPAP